MTQIALICRRFDSFCARLNAGLAAVAICLAILTAIIIVGRHPDLFLAPVDMESGEAELF